MIKRIVSLLLIFTLLCSVLPVYAAEDSGNIVLSQRFGSVAENGTSVSGIKFITGVDTRVITDDGNKVLTSRAFGDSAKIMVDSLSGMTDDEAVYSAKIKMSGEKTTGKFFSAMCSGKEINLLTLASDGYVKLADGKRISGAPTGRYITYTLVVNWQKGLMDVYMDEKCVASDWIMTETSTVKPTSVSWSIAAPAEGESSLFVDDVYFYNGDKLPWKIDLPVEKANDEVLEYTPTTELAPPELVKSLEFNTPSAPGVSIYLKDNSGTFIPGIEEETGIGLIKLYSDAEITGGSYFDITDDAISTLNRYVVDVCFRVNELTGGSKFHFLDSKDALEKWRMGYDGQNGNLVTNTGKIGIGSYIEGQWTRMSVAYDISSAKAEIYVNGKHTGTQSISDTFIPTIFRFDISSPLGGVHDVDVDWVRIYTGDQLLEAADLGIDEGSGEVAISDTSVMNPTDKIKAAFKDKTVFMTTNNKFYYNGEKQDYKDETYVPSVINGTLMIPQNLLAMVTGKEVTYDAATGAITFGNAEMTVNDANYKLSGSAKTLSAAPTVSNGILYFPLISVFEQIQGKTVTYDPRGDVIIADYAVPVDRYHYTDDAAINLWKESDLIFREMQFDYASGSEMINALVSNWPNNQHPRVYYTMDDAEYILTKVESGSKEWKTAYNQIINNADYNAKRDLTKIYTPDKSTGQDYSATALNAMKSLSLAYLLTGDTKYAVKGAEILDGITTWPTLSYSQLTYGHWMAAVAIGYDAFYNYLVVTESGRETLAKYREAIYNLALAPHIQQFASGGQSLNWIDNRDNFVGVIGGSLMMLLCAVADEADLKDASSYLLESSLRPFTNYASLFFPDGAWYEGVGYTSYGIELYMYALAAMKNCFNNLYGIETMKGFSEVGYSMSYLQSPQGNFNFHDSDEGYKKDLIREFFGYLFNDPVQAQMGRVQLSQVGGDYTIHSLFYYWKAIEQGGMGIPDISSMPTDKYFYSADAGVFMNSLEVATPTYVGFHAGPLGLPHDMLDQGQFVFHADGVVWAKDLGGDDYDLESYFNIPKGYNIYRKRPEGENCLVLNPQVHEDEDGNAYYGQTVGAMSEIVAMDMNKPRGAFFAYDLSEGYSRDASEYIRGYYFGDNRNTLTVQDEVTVNPNTEVYWFMHTDHNIEIISNNQAKITTEDGKQLIADVYCDAPGFELTKMNASPLPTTPNVSGQNKNEGVTKLALHIPSATGKVNIAVKLSPITGDYQYTPLTFTPIANWSVPEGPMPEKASLEYLTINGQVYEGAVKGLREINVELPFGTQTAPVIGAVSSNATVTSLSQPATPYDTIQMTLEGEGLISQTIKVNFTVSTERPVYITQRLVNVNPVAGVPGTVIRPVGSDGQTIPQQANGPDKLIDGDFATRYAQSGYDVWFEVDFGEVKDISGVAAAFYDGHTRYQNYEILYSEDGINFTRVWQGKSLGTTSEYESLAIPGRVRYIRLVGNGNSTSEWNSVTELCVYK